MVYNGREKITTPEGLAKLEDTFKERYESVISDYIDMEGTLFGEQGLYKTQLTKIVEIPLPERYHERLNTIIVNANRNKRLLLKKLTQERLNLIDIVNSLSAVILNGKYLSPGDTELLVQKVTQFYVELNKEIETRIGLTTNQVEDLIKDTKTKENITKRLNEVKDAFNEGYNNTMERCYHIQETLENIIISINRHRTDKN